MNQRFHALLIGIDAYPVKPLRGCVNDIDAVQRLLLHRLQVPPHQIRRLASPHPGVAHDASVPAQAATLANIRAGFAELASDHVSAGDRVFIYFAGHGAYAEVIGNDSRTARHESLVPVDVFEPGGPNLLLAHELNFMLREITARTASVAIVLDCSQAEGATRDSERAGRISRSLDVSAHASLWRDHGPGLGSVERALVAVRDDCQIVAACLSHEMALEDDAGGVPHGVFTRALVGALSAVSDVDLATTTWSRIWPALRSEMANHSPWQTPWLNAASSAVFAGPRVEGDAGYGIKRIESGYEISAGTLDGVTPGATVAIYGEFPRWLPPVDSEADHASRIGVVKVVSADRSTARAQFDGGAFVLPFCARARLVKAGSWAKLRCAISPPDEVALRSIRESPLLEVAEPSLAQVRLDQVGDRWVLHDEVHATDTGFALAEIEASDLRGARDVFEHYFHYALPLRLAALGRGLPGALELVVLSCAWDLSADEAQNLRLPEAPSSTAATYDLRSGDRVCFRVANRSADRLRVTLLASAASGKVQLLGDQIIDAGADYVFWAGNALGRPFVMSPPQGRRRCIDRLVAIGTASMAADFHHLRVNTTFAAALERMRGNTRDVAPDIGEDEPDWLPTEPWTAAQAIVRTYAG